MSVICGCCGLDFKFCKCKRWSCEQCGQCETHCECQEQHELNQKLKEVHDRREARMMSLAQQKRNLANGLMASGMKPSEAISKARNWWDDIGRKLVHTIFNKEQVGGSFKATSGRAPGIKVSPTLQPVVPSGILNGLPWARLDKREKFEIVLKWHKTEIMMDMPLLEQKLILELFDNKTKH